MGQTRGAALGMDKNYTCDFPKASSVNRGWHGRPGHNLEHARTKRGYRGCDGVALLSDVPYIPLPLPLGDAGGDAPSIEKK
jgi:hypothetical protein